MSDWFRAVTAGGGDTGRLAAETDWAQTPLGDPSSWPQGLRSAVELCFSTRFPVMIAWGDELTKIYNDGYRPMLGSKKHPAAMGASAFDIWAEIWDDVGPSFDEVLRTGVPTWVVDQPLIVNRSGFDEETYFTYSYSPLRDDDGVVRGVLDIATETTAHVLERRRMSCLDAVHRTLGVAGDDLGDLYRRVTEVLTCCEDVVAADLYLRTGDGLAAPPRHVESPLPSPDGRPRAGAPGRRGPRGGGDRDRILAPLGYADADRRHRLGGAGPRSQPPATVRRGVPSVLPSARQLDRRGRELLGPPQPAGERASPHQRRPPAVDDVDADPDRRHRRTLRPRNRQPRHRRRLVRRGPPRRRPPRPHGRRLRRPRPRGRRGDGAAAQRQPGPPARGRLAGGDARRARPLRPLDARRRVHHRAVRGHRPASGRRSPSPRRGTRRRSPSRIAAPDGSTTWSTCPSASCPTSSGARPPRALGPGELVVLYTDGLIERRGERLDDGFARLAAAVSGLDRSLPLEHLADEIVDALTPDGSRDDVAILLHQSGAA